MIYLITGVPGSGKTLYAVSTLLQKLLKETIKGKDGAEVKRRLCIDGIPNLVIPHELMADKPESPAWTADGKKAPEAEPEGDGLWNWFKWCRPGDVIVCDEVQRHWRPRAMGTKVPPEIAMLETHRHFGVDFVIITQSPMLLDQNVRRLVGRHLNVRRIFGGGRALIYDWDGCQTDVHRTAGSTKTLWNYPRSAYKLYRSSELHTKQHQKIPLWFAFPLVVLALGAFAGPKGLEVMQRTMTGKTVAAQAPSAGKPFPAASTPARAASEARAAPAAPPAAPPGAITFASGSVIMGCIRSARRCECFGQDGSRVDVAPLACEEGSHRVGSLVPLAASTAAHRPSVPSAPPQAASAGTAAAPGQPAMVPDAGAVKAIGPAGIVS